MTAPAAPMPSRGPTRLRRLARQAAVEQEAALERCELCSEPIPPEHRHLLDLDSRELLCACRACSTLFDHRAAGGRHYRLVPDRRLLLEGFELDDVAWTHLRIPVDMAFFLALGREERIAAYYPSPMGPTESRLGLEAWTEIERANPVLGSLAPEVEALLVNRARGARQHFLVPIEDCYALVGLIRTHWRGLTGGKEVWAEIERFYARLAERSKAVRADGKEAECRT